MTVISSTRLNSPQGPGDFVCASYSAEWVFGETAGLGTRVVQVNETLRAPSGDTSVSSRTPALVIPPSGSAVLASRTAFVSFCGYRNRTSFSGVPLPDTLYNGMDAVFSLVDDKGNAQTLNASIGFEQR
jgi:hypothetical protein